ncbi:unnamed protein product, partial [Discosporangium mesarthrocarpum]
MKQIEKKTRREQVNQLFIIGGDGTHRGAHRIAVECMSK